MVILVLVVSLIQLICFPLVGSLCPTMYCTKWCAEGYVASEDGCSTCRCRREVHQYQLREGQQQCAGPRACTNLCVKSPGYRVDTVGCGVCGCDRYARNARARRFRCDAPNCRTYCDQYRNDSMGCPTCHCEKEPVQCPLVYCSTYCRNGYVTTEDSCPVCTCLSDEAASSRASHTPPCNAPACQSACPTAQGYMVTGDGCPTCTCGPDQSSLASQCPLVHCKRYCVAGYVAMDDGCPICQCRTDVTDQEAFGSERLICEAPLCDPPCPAAQGYMVTADGCPTCQCGPEVSLKDAKSDEFLTTT